MLSKYTLSLRRGLITNQIADLKYALCRARIVNVYAKRSKNQIVIRVYGRNPHAPRILAALDPLVERWRYTIADVYTYYDAPSARRRYCQVRIDMLAPVVDITL